jgi:DNA-binding MarR family transcriptional regulator
MMHLLPLVMKGMKRIPEPEASEFHMRFHAAGLGGRHAPVVMFLALEGAMGVSELAEHIALAPATTSLLVNELSRAGVVERREDERDRRRTIVSLAPEYEAFTRKRVEELMRPLRRTLSRLDPQARACFMSGLRILLEEVRGDSNVTDAACCEAVEEKAKKR